MGYQSDIKASGDDELLTTLNRHTDNYSSSDLTGETALMTARIAYLLRHLDRTNKDTIDFEWQKIEKAIAIKCKLVETQARLAHAIATLTEAQRINDERIVDLREKRLLAERKDKTVTPEEFQESIEKATSVIFKYVRMEDVPALMNELKSIVELVSVPKSK